MQDKSTIPDSKDGAATYSGDIVPDLNADQDGRNREWEDRARVNLEIEPEGTKTNLERDFEPEKISENKNKNADPAY